MNSDKDLHTVGRSMTDLVNRINQAFCTKWKKLFASSMRVGRSFKEVNSDDGSSVPLRRSVADDGTILGRQNQ